MNKKLRMPGDVVIFPEADGRWVAMNVFARMSLGLDSAALAILRAAEELNDEELEAKFSGQIFRVWEIECFSNHNGLTADPTRYTRDIRNWPTAEELNASELIRCCRKHCLILENETDYRARFADKRSLLDGERLGNFHQQLGQELLLGRRESPSTWWVRQKFTEDMRQVRNNLYKAVQEYNLKRYFKRKLSRGDSVVDLGCGIGVYSNLISTTGASVLGIDPNKDYIRLAREHAEKGVRCEVSNISEVGALDWIPSQSADFVFMSDALLFYFVPASPDQTADIEQLFRDVRRILKPGGTFISVEPHYWFWLLPWLGDVDRPFTLLTEYAHRSFRVTPTLSQLIQAYARGGFKVIWMEEFMPDPTFEATDARAYNFAAEFPLWQLYELKAAG
jgi:SAM-dependent methyltransferase